MSNKNKNKITNRLFDDEESHQYGVIFFWPKQQNYATNVLHESKKQ